MTNLQKIKLAQIIGSAQFWTVTFVLYMTTQGLSIEQTYLLLSIFSILVVVLEYPTGVIGDHFSHRLSITLGYFAFAIVFFLLSFPGSFAYYLTALIFGALGTSLISGSDTALLHSISKDFKKDSSDVRMYSIIVAAISLFLGGYLASIDLRLPIYCSIITSFIPGLLILSMKKIPRTDDFDGNIFKRSLEGLRHVRDNTILFHLMILSSIFGAFFLSFKWFYNPLFMELHIPVSSWGLIVGFATILIALGTYIYKRLSHAENITTPIGIFIGLICLVGVTMSPTLSLIALVSSQLLRGYISSLFDVELNNAITGTTSRASILSLKSLFVRLFSSMYIFGAGFVLGKSSFLVLMVLTATLLLTLTVIPILKITSLKKI